MILVQADWPEDLSDESVGLLVVFRCFFTTCHAAQLQGRIAMHASGRTCRLRPPVKKLPTTPPQLALVTICCTPQSRDASSVSYSTTLGTPPCSGLASGTLCDTANVAASTIDCGWVM